MLRRGGGGVHKLLELEPGIFFPITHLTYTKTAAKNWDQVYNFLETRFVF